MFIAYSEFNVACSPVADVSHIPAKAFFKLNMLRIQFQPQTDMRIGYGVNPGTDKIPQTTEGAVQLQLFVLHLIAERQDVTF